jgi:hypothetical protein
MQIIGTGKQRAGKTSRVLVGATPLTFASWEVGLEGEDFPTVNFESYNVAAQETFDEGIMGALASSIRFGGDWDAGTNPLDEPPGLYPRDDLASLGLQVSRLDGVGWSFPYARLRSATCGADVKGKVTFNCSGKNQGPFTYPAGSV